MKDKSYVNHQPQVKLASFNHPLVAPVHLSTKFTVESLQELDDIVCGRPSSKEEGSSVGYFYSRIANPTVRQLELLLARLQQREEAMVVSSGIAAVSTCLFSLLKAGDHVVLFVESYKPTRYLVKNLLSKFGVSFTMTSLKEYAEHSPIIAGKTKLILLESPTNPLVYIHDLQKVIAEAKQKGVLTLLDNTFAGPHNHGELPIDIYVHSLTKYVAGHGDVIAGAIISSKDIIDRMRMDAIQIGPTMDPQGAYMVLRGLKTYFLRYQAQTANALYVASRLEKHPRVKSLLYPFLPSHPQHTLAKSQMKDGGGMFSFQLVPSSSNSKMSHQQILSLFIESLQMIKLAASLGSTETLVSPVELLFAADLSEEEKEKAGIHPLSVRISTGIEDSEDILHDLEQALEKI